MGPARTYRGVSVYVYTIPEARPVESTILPTSMVARLTPTAIGELQKRTGSVLQPGHTQWSIESLFVSLFPELSHQPLCHFETVVLDVGRKTWEANGMQNRREACLCVNPP
jgi:hypothetical protein